MAVAREPRLGSTGDGHRSRPLLFARLTTQDRDEAERVVTDLYLPNRLDLSESSVPLAMEIAGLRLGALTIGRLTYGRRVHLRTADADHFHVNLPLRGQAASKSGNSEFVTTGQGSALVFSPGAPAEMSWSADCEQLCLMIPRTRLEAELEHLLGRPLKGHLSFEFAADRDTPRGRQWGAVLNLLAEEVHQPTDMSQNPVMWQHVEALMLDGLLVSRPHNHTDAMMHDRHVRLGASVKRAITLIEERPDKPWTTVRLATEVHLSVRALQDGFRRGLGTTPMKYLRQTRLRRARQLLLVADRDATTVGAVAVGLGILHRGRFSAAYQDAFGESPSDTLSRSA